MTIVIPLQVVYTLSGWLMVWYWLMKCLFACLGDETRNRRRARRACEREARIGTNANGIDERIETQSSDHREFYPPGGEG